MRSRVVTATHRESLLRFTRLLRTGTVPLAAALAATMVGSPVAASPADQPVHGIATHDNGGAGTAEIVAHDPASQRLFVGDGANGRVTVLDATDLTVVAQVPVAGELTSVAVRPGPDALVAVAVADGTNPGSVLFLDVDGNQTASVVVGDLDSGTDSSLPDSLAFTPDGTKLVVANEGEVDGLVDPEGAISVIDVTGPVTQGDVTDLDFRDFNAGGGQDISGDDGFHFDPAAMTIAQDIEPEFVSATDTTAFVSLQEVNGLAKVDLDTLTITDVFPMGYVDRSVDGNGLDASDVDGEIAIETYDGIFGMPQPDGVDVFEVGGTEYVITANEGDARDPNESTVMVEDPAAPYAAPEDAGNLKVSASKSDATAQYAFGSRSFSVLDTDGNVLFDSGDDLEQRIAELFPASFNSDDPVDTSGSDFDDRSDDKGPEPEGVVVGEVDGTTYAFIGLERHGGVMVYDLTDPTAPAFVQYVVGRNLVDYERGLLDWDGSGTIDEGDVLDYETNGGDVSPEGLVFVSADESPTGEAILVTANEVSGTVTTYALDEALGTVPAPATVVGERDLDIDFVRTAGPDRVATAVEVSKVAYPDGADTVFVATADNYADALTGGPLAASLDAPILLTKRDFLNADTADEIERLDPDEIVVLGGPVAIADPTFDAIEDLGYPVDRIAGASRFETAQEINQRLTGGEADRVFVVEGTNPDDTRGWPDAVSVSAYAAFTRTPIVPIASDDVPSASAATFAELEPSEYVVIGGPVAITDGTFESLGDDDDTVRRLAGGTRFETSALIYDEAVTQGLGTDEKWLATGRKFPDALTGGAAAGRLGVSLLLVESANGVTSVPATVDRLNSAYDTIEVVRFLGGPIAIPEQDAEDVEELLTLDEPAAAELCLTVLHNNDGESQLVDAGRGLEQFGGAARFATTLLRERARGVDEAANCEKQGVLTVTSGDNFLAGPELSASRDNGVPFYDSKLYDYLDYDAIALGNHDFDFGLDVTNDFIRGFTDATPFLSANLDTGVEGPMAVNVNLDRLQPSTTVEVAGETVGVIGLTTPTLPSISSPEGTRILGLEDDGTEDLDELAAIVAAERTKLEAQGADVIVLISHLQGLDSDQALIERLEGVDVVVAGGGDEILATPGELLVPGDHTEIFGSYPLAVEDASGTALPVVTTAGSYKYVGRLGVRFDADGDLVQVDRDSRMVRVADEDVFDGVADDPWVQANVVDPVVDFTEGLASDVIATTQVPLDGVRQRVRTQETNVGSLLADGIADAARERAGQFGLDNGAPFVGLANGGGIRNDSVIPAGDVTTLDTFDIAPFSNLVAVFTDVTEAELDTILEHAYAEIENVDGRFAQLSGLDVTVDRDAPAGQRVTSITLDGGAPVGTVNLALPDFTARGGDGYPVEGLGDFTVVGVSYQQALADFLSELGTVTAAEYPDLRESTADATRIFFE